MVTYDSNGRFYRYRDLLEVIAERVWNSANMPSRCWSKQSRKMKDAFIADLRSDIAEVRMFSPHADLPGIERIVRPEPWSDQ